MNGVALVGEPGSGKSTIAEALEQQLGWRRISFAGPLKDEAAYALAAVKTEKWPSQYYIKVRAEMDNPDTKDKYRGLLQWWGTEYRRGGDPTYWLDLFEKYLAFDTVGGGYVVDDCRYNNEHELLTSKYKFKFVKLESGETTRPVQAHASEVDWKTWDYDLVLSYEKGPEHQAQRIVEALSLG